MWLCMMVQRGVSFFGDCFVPIQDYRQMLKIWVATGASCAIKSLDVEPSGGQVLGEFELGGKS